MELAKCMQDRYTGDVGDYGKYLLLRELAGVDLRLAVVWYLNPFEEGNTDGKFTRYLDDAYYGNAEPVVYDSLKRIVREGPRKVSSIKIQKILPKATMFYEVPLEYARLATDRNSRERLRYCWFNGALNEVQPAQLIFLDPDNGLEVMSCSACSKAGAKYATISEVHSFLNREKSVVLYQHRNHVGKIEDQVEDVFCRLKIGGKKHSGWAISFHAFSTRIYFVFPAPGHTSQLKTRLMEFCRKPNNCVFKLRVYRLNCLP